MGLIDRVAERVATTRQGPKNFFDRLPVDQQEKLTEIRRQFQSGELKVSAVKLAGILEEEAAVDGMRLCGQQGLRVWLAKTP